MAGQLPKFIVFHRTDTKNVAEYYKDDTGEVGVNLLPENSVFNPLARIEVERADIGNKQYVHLKFVHTNKYFAITSNDGRWITPISNQPEEDTSKLSCTLFEPIVEDRGVSFNHVQSGGAIHVHSNSRLYVTLTSRGVFTVLDWDTLVKLPERVAFKGDNGKYLRAYWFQDHEYNQFSSNDRNAAEAAYRVQLHRDGNLLIKSEHFGKFWRGQPTWIWADSNDNSGNDKNTLFWPVKVDDSTIALRCGSKNQFCRRTPDLDWKTDCYRGDVSTITNETKLVVEELVLERDIYNVRYRMEDARISNEAPFLAGVGTNTNYSDAQSTLTLTVTYEDRRSTTFSNSLSLMAGIKTTFEAGIPLIVEGSIEISAEVSDTLEWGTTSEVTKTVEAKVDVPVPPRSKAKINYVGTQGTCSVPFSYTQKDHSSTDGQMITTEHIDGICTGVNYYSFRFEQLAFEPLDE